MGLEKILKLNILGQLLIFEKAFHVIDSFSGNGEYAEISVYIYDNVNKENLIAKRFYSFPLINNDGNVIDQGYNYLLSTIDYEGAIKVV